MSDIAQANGVAAHRSGRFAAIWPVCIAAALGVVLVSLAGFAGSQSIHNAAHDARHSLNFPCH
ncbi:MAG TPA: CbtB domain-containing protein [Burkholderiales bacterium]|nr:CbtB domain-containing protein [Burkholderiales bacterium]